MAEDAVKSVETPAAVEDTSAIDALMADVNKIIGDSVQMPAPAEPVAAPVADPDIVSKLADKFAALIEDKPAAAAPVVQTATPAAAAPVSSDATAAAAAKAVSAILDGLEIPEIDDTYSDELRKLPKAIRTIAERADERVKLVTERFEGLLKELIPHIAVLQSDRRVREFDDFVSELVGENAELQSVFGSGPSSRIADTTTQAKARKDLFKGLDRLSNVEDENEFKIMREALVQAVSRKYKTKDSPGGNGTMRISRVSSRPVNKDTDTESMLADVEKIIARGH